MRRNDERGDIAGNTVAAYGSAHPVRWRDGHIENLGLPERRERPRGRRRLWRPAEHRAQEPLPVPRRCGRRAVASGRGCATLPTSSRAASPIATAAAYDAE